MNFIFLFTPFVFTPVFAVKKQPITKHKIEFTTKDKFILVGDLYIANPKTDKPLVVALHSFSMNAKVWEGITQNLRIKGYNVLAMKYASYNVQEQVLGIVRIVKMIVLIGLYVVLFFISYFVIKLIENSKKVYYATVRILGASRKVIKNLITIELLTVYHLTYILFVIFIYFSYVILLHSIK